MNKKLKLAMVPLAMSVFLVGCGNNNEVVVSVGDDELTQEELQQDMLELYGKSYANSYISESLIKQEAEKLKIKVTKDQVNKAFEEEAATQGMSAADYETQIKNYYGVTKDVYTKNIETGLLLAEVIYKTYTPKESDLKAYFEKNKEQFNTEAQVKASHILVEKEEDAKKYIEELDKSKDIKADFAKLAKEHSTDTGTKDNGGELGFFTKDSMVEEFSNVAFSLKKGEFTKEPVKSEYGYHVIYVTDVKKAKEATYENSKEEIEEAYKSQLQNEKYNEWQEKVKKDYKIVNTLEKEEKEEK